MSKLQRKLYAREMTKERIDPETGTINEVGDAYNMNNGMRMLYRCCNHPYMFRDIDWFLDDRLVQCSGKLMFLDKLLPRLKQQGLC